MKPLMEVLEIISTAAGSPGNCLPKGFNKMTSSHRCDSCSKSLVTIVGTLRTSFVC